MDDLRKNGSGYTDPTAYKAMKKILEEDKMEEARRGEIWEVELKNGTRDELVVQQKPGYITCLLLQDERPKMADPVDIMEVASKSLMYADAGKMTYVATTAPRQDIKSPTADKMDEIMKMIVHALHFPEWHERVQNVVKEKTDTTDLIQARTERDIYKDLYSELMERVMKGV